MWGRSGAEGNGVGKRKGRGGEETGEEERGGEESGGEEEYSSLDSSSRVHKGEGRLV